MPNGIKNVALLLLPFLLLSQGAAAELGLEQSVLFYARHCLKDWPNRNAQLLASLKPLATYHTQMLSEYRAAEAMMDSIQTDLDALKNSSASPDSQNTVCSNEQKAHVKNLETTYQSISRSLDVLEARDADINALIDKNYDLLYNAPTKDVPDFICHFSGLGMRQTYHESVQTYLLGDTNPLARYADVDLVFPIATRDSNIAITELKGFKTEILRTLEQVSVEHRICENLDRQ